MVPAVDGAYGAGTPFARSARESSAAALPGRSRLLGRLCPHLPRRRAAHPDDRTRAGTDQEAGIDALDLHGPRTEGVRVGWREGVLAHSGRQTSHRDRAATR